MTDRWHARLPGILMLASGAIAVAALAIPDAWAVALATAPEALDVVHDRRAGYQLASVLWAVTGIAALLGLLAFGAQTVVSARRPLSTAGSGLVSAGILLWIVALVTTSTNILMTDAQGGTASDLSYLVLGEIGHVLWLVAFLAIAVGFAALGFGLHGPARVVCWVASLVLAAFVAVVHDVPPFLVFLLALPALGLTTLIAGRRRPLGRE
jgi:hypothetical protein